MANLPAPVQDGAECPFGLVSQVELGVFTQEEVEESITSEFNPVRARFHGSPDVWTRDVLNLGVRPDRLVERVSSNAIGLASQAGLHCRHEE
jgi:hypothetical protein